MSPPRVLEVELVPDIQNIIKTNFLEGKAFESIRASYEAHEVSFVDAHFSCAHSIRGAHRVNLATRNRLIILHPAWLGRAEVASELLKRLQTRDPSKRSQQPGKHLSKSTIATTISMMLLFPNRPIWDRGQFGTLRKDYK